MLTRKKKGPVNHAACEAQPSCLVPSAGFQRCPLQGLGWRLTGSLLDWHGEVYAFWPVGVAGSRSGSAIWSGGREKLAKFVFSLKPLIFFTMVLPMGRPVCNRRCRLWALRLKRDTEQTRYVFIRTKLYGCLTFSQK